MSLPAGVTASNARLSSRAAGHSVAFETLNNGRRRLQAFSAENELIDGHNGTLVTFTLTADDTYAGGGEMRLSDIIIVKPNMERTTLDGLNVSLGQHAPTVTAVDAVDSSDVNIYALGSQVVIESPEAGNAVIASMSGRTLTVAIAPGRNIFNLPGSGVYIVKAGDKALKIKVTK